MERFNSGKRRLPKYGRVCMIDSVGAMANVLGTPSDFGFPAPARTIKEAQRRDAEAMRKDFRRAIEGLIEILPSDSTAVPQRQPREQ